MASFEDLQKQKEELFKRRRMEASQGAESAAQQASDALTRRFAALGAQGSGASIAAQMKVQEAGQAQKQRAMQDVDAAELESRNQDLAFRMQQEEAEKGRSFQREMAERDLALKREMFGTEQGNKLKELDLAQKQFELDKDTTEFNRRLAEIEAGREPEKPHGLGRAVEGTMAGVKKDFLVSPIVKPLNSIVSAIRKFRIKL